MKNKLSGWELVEGMTGMWATPSPRVSEVIAALEAIRPEVESPFITLVAPAVRGGESSYCQAYANDPGYTCEIRICSKRDFRHFRGFLPDAEGNIGSMNERVYPNLSQTIRIFTDFIKDRTILPTVGDVAWLDVSGEFEPAII